MTEWIGIKDALPPFGEKVLLYGIKEHEDSADIHLGSYCNTLIHDEYRNYVGEEAQFWASEYGYDIDVTHWMPLPRAPNE